MLGIHPLLVSLLLLSNVPNWIQAFPSPRNDDAWIPILSKWPRLAHPLEKYNPTLPDQLHDLTPVVEDPLKACEPIYVVNERVFQGCVRMDAVKRNGVVMAFCPKRVGSTEASGSHSVHSPVLHQASFTKEDEDSEDQESSDDAIEQSSDVDEEEQYLKKFYKGRRKSKIDRGKSRVESSKASKGKPTQWDGTKRDRSSSSSSVSSANSAKNTTISTIKSRQVQWVWCQESAVKTPRVAISVKAVKNQLTQAVTKSFREAEKDVKSLLRSPHQCRPMSHVTEEQISVFGCVGRVTRVGQNGLPSVTGLQCQDSVDDAVWHECRTVDPFETVPASHCLPFYQVGKQWFHGCNSQRMVGNFGSNHVMLSPNTFVSMTPPSFQRAQTSPKYVPPHHRRRDSWDAGYVDPAIVTEAIQTKEATPWCQVRQLYGGGFRYCEPETLSWASSLDYRRPCRIASQLDSGQFVFGCVANGKKEKAQCQIQLDGSWQTCFVPPVLDDSVTQEKAKLHLKLMWKDYEDGGKLDRLNEEQLKLIEEEAQVENEIEVIEEEIENEIENENELDNGMNTLVQQNEMDALVQQDVQNVDEDLGSFQLPEPMNPDDTDGFVSPASLGSSPIHRAALIHSFSSENFGLTRVLSQVEEERSFAASIDDNVQVGTYLPGVVVFDALELTEMNSNQVLNEENSGDSIATSDSMIVSSEAIEINTHSTEATSSNENIISQANATFADVDNLHANTSYSSNEEEELLLQLALANVRDTAELPAPLFVVRERPLVALHRFLDRYERFEYVHVNELEKLRVYFKGEVGVDGGALTRDFIRLCAEQMLTKSPYFELLENGIYWRPSPSYELDDANKTHAFYKRVGQVLAMAWYFRVNLSVPMWPCFWKLLLGRRLERFDLQVCDSDLHWNLCQLLTQDVNQEGLTFSVNTRKGKVIEFFENGHLTAVHNQNKDAYIDLYASYHMFGYNRDAYYSLYDGFTKWVDIPDDSTLSFMSVVTSTAHIDREQWRLSTRYGNHLNSTSEVTKYFWRFVNEADEETLRTIIHFTTGSELLPVGGFSALKPLFMLADKPHFSNSHFPNFQACFHTIYLPHYTSFEMFKERMQTALTHQPKDFYSMA